MSIPAYETELRALYQQLIDGWNNRDAAEMAAPFAEDGEQIGFDGSQIHGRAEIAAHVAEIFAHHPTPPYVTKIKQVRLLTPDVADIRAIGGMIPPGGTELAPSLNAHHTLIAVKRDGQWQIALFQNTPAHFHGRPELVEQMTEELRQLL